MKIAILGTRGYPSSYGGFETFVRHFAPFARSLGHEVVVYGRELPGTNLIDGIKVVNAGGFESKRASTLTHGLTATLHARRADYDVCLLLNSANGLFLPLLGDIPTVLNPDGLEWERGKWGTIARVLFRAGAKLAAKRATTVVADSQEIARHWRNHFGRDPQFIPYGATMPSATATDFVDCLPFAGRTYALVVARLAPENNVDMVLDAFQELDRPMHLVVVGDANHPTATAARLAELDRTDDHLTWLGRIDNQEHLSQLWRNASIYIHGHSVGGTNPALLQGMASGAGPLAFNSPFNAEVLGERDHLFSTAEQLTKLWRCAIDGDPADRSEWAQHCMQRVQKAYAWPDVCAAYLSALAEAADQKHADCPPHATEPRK